MTARLIAGWIALAAFVPAGVALAGPNVDAVGMTLAAVHLGQTDTKADPKDRADELCRRARQAMAENDLAAAEALVAEAESLGVNYGPLYWRDTPEKVRADLERKKSAGAGERPSQKFTPFGLGKSDKPAPSDPFLQGRDAANLPKLPDAKARAVSAVKKGRTALAQNDLAAAAHWHRTALAEGATFGPNEDSPAKLAADIQARGGKVDSPVRPLPDPGPRPSVVSFDPVGPAGPVRRSPYPATSGNSPGGEAGFAVADDGSSVLSKGYGLPQSSTRSGAAGPSEQLRQARLALAEGDVRRASAFVEKAKAQPKQYGPLDDTPQQVEEDIRRYEQLTANPENTEIYRRAYSKMLLGQARALINTNDFDAAERLAQQAARQQVTYGPLEVRPENLLAEIAQRRAQSGGSPAAKSPAGAASVASKSTPPDIGPSRRDPRVVPAGAQMVTKAGGAGPYASTASQAVYNPANDPTRNVPAQATGPQPPQPPMPLEPRAPPTMPAGPMAAPQSGPAEAANPGMALFQQGEAALREHDVPRAVRLYQQAAQHMDQLDPLTQQRLQSKLQMLSVPGRVSPPSGAAPTMADEAAAQAQIRARGVSAELAQQESKARALQQSDPKQAISLLEEARKKVEDAGLDPANRQRLLARVDRQLAEIRKYVETHQPLVDLQEKNERIRDEVAREQRVRLEIDEKIALMIDDFNRHIEQQEFEKAEVIAKRAAELAPNNPTVQQINLWAKFVRRNYLNEQLRADKEEGFIAQLRAVDEASVGFNDNEPIRFPTSWEDITKSRERFAGDRGRKRTEQEIEIENRLKTPVMLEFENTPLSAVLDYLSDVSDINIHLDPLALEEYGVDSNTPVTINVRREIMLRSALNLILEPLSLTYVIKDEVLKITTARQREGEVYQVVYNVADLVIPIPNFVPTSRMGLAGAYHDALGNIGYGGGGPMGGAGGPMAVLASKEGSGGSAMINPALLSQISGPSMGSRQTGPIGFGPGGLGGGTQADFDSIIELITTTIQPTTWDEVGGPGSIAPFETNLSLVVSQTQDVHEEIVDLLEQLRRLQDLQVTIEVRFITLNDNFFERIGVDFDFDIDDNIDRPFQVFGRTTGDGDPDGGQEPPRNTLDVDGDKSVTVGLSAPGVFSADLDIPFTQDSFGLAVPQFGGFDATAGAQMGFAILSDIEAFFFISAAQGDRRSNVLQAPKVTLFNGQQAFVSDTSQSPFVISVIPVVGDFAAAQQPVIVVLNEGTHMTVQAVVSNDRRFVRLTVVPYFSRIGEVNTFQFTGSQTSTTDTTAEGFQNLGDEDNPDWRRLNESDSGTVTRSGTTVQLPTFSFVTVTTTVSVPDGGTVLLGGIKRLSEGRNEFGTPILNKIPYINRLFKNVGIGRETQSLMMMVTPRIIIQEEEEEKIGILPPT